MFGKLSSLFLCYRSIKSSFSTRVVSFLREFDLYLVPAFAGFICLFLASTRPENDLAQLDRMFLWRGAITPPPEVVIVALDTKTFFWGGATIDRPWPRRNWAKLLDKLVSYAPAAVGLDISFKYESSDPEADALLARAIERLPVVLPEGKQFRQVNAAGSEVTYDILLYKPLPIFKKVSKGTGYVGVLTDKGIQRRFPAGLKVFDEESLAEATVRVAGRKITPENLPSGFDFMNFYGPSGHLTHISGLDILHDQVDPSLIKGKVVFIGPYTNDDIPGWGLDQKVIPYTTPIAFGVELHATAAANLMEGKWIKRVEPLWEILFQTFIVILSSFLCWKINNRKYEWIPCFLPCASWITLIYPAFLRGYYLPGFWAFWCIILVYGIKQLVHLFTAIQVAKRLKASLSNYLNPSVVDEMARGITKVTSDTNNSKLTILFTDIEGYSTLAQNTSSEEVYRFLSGYFRNLLSITESEKGRAMSMPGDSLFAIYTDEEEEISGPDRALATAIQIEKKVSEVAGEGGVFLRTRIGIHHGEVTVGKLGSETQFMHTAIGDDVNVGARLESLNSLLGTSILISSETKKLLKNQLYAAVPMGGFQLTGRSAVTEVYAVMTSRMEERVVAAWEEALYVFSQRNWEKAKAFFFETSCLDSRFSKAAEFYIRAIEKYSRSKPGLNKHWSGFVVVSKVEDVVEPRTFL